MVRKIVIVVSALLVAGGALLAWMYHVATADPVVRIARVPSPELSAPLRLVLMSDIHVAGPDMPPARVQRLVGQVNSLHPDFVLIAGDFVSDKRTASRRYNVSDAIAPLVALTPRIGTYAVLGNHDHWRDAQAVRSELQRAGINVLSNRAVTAGPLTIGGVDDPYTGHDNAAREIQQMRAHPRPRILLSHSPDIFPQVPADVLLTLAGHTHCGQIRLPFAGAVSTMSAYGEKYACGRVDENGRVLIVSAGLGTSLLPLRLGAIPDLWLIELRPVRPRN
jgi:predicted MPP superfamily phosphohydrolase